MNPIIAKIRSSPTLMAVIAVLLFTALGFIGGRFLAPSKVTTVSVQDTESKKRLEEALKVTQQLQEKLAVSEKRLKDVKVRTVVVTRTVTLSNGTTTRDTTRTTDTDTHVATDTNTTRDTTNNTVLTDNRTLTDDSHSHTATTTTTWYNQGPKWAVSAFATAQLVGPVNPTDFKAIQPQLLYGATGGYRFWGPLWLDVSGGGSLDLRTQSKGWFAGVGIRGTFTF